MELLRPLALGMAAVASKGMKLGGVGAEEFAFGWS